MNVSSKGQVTIPQAIRDRLGLLPNTAVVFEVAGDAVRIRKAAGEGRRGKGLVALLKGRGTVKLTTDEIMSLTRGEK